MFFPQYYKRKARATGWNRWRRSPSVVSCCGSPFSLGLCHSISDRLLTSFEFKRIGIYRAGLTTYVRFRDNIRNHTKKGKRGLRVKTVMIDRLTGHYFFVVNNYYVSTTFLSPLKLKLQ